MLVSCVQEGRRHKERPQHDCKIRDRLWFCTGRIGMYRIIAQRGTTYQGWCTISATNLLQFEVHHRGIRTHCHVPCQILNNKNLPEQRSKLFRTPIRLPSLRSLFIRTLQYALATCRIISAAIRKFSIHPFAYRTVRTVGPTSVVTRYRACRPFSEGKGRVCSERW